MRRMKASNTNIASLKGGESMESKDGGGAVVQHNIREHCDQKN